MPDTGVACTELQTLIDTGLGTCFPEARAELLAAIANIRSLICWPIQRAYLNAFPNQVLPGNLDTIVAWDIQSVVNPVAMHTIGSGDILIQEPGIYTFTACVNYHILNATDELTLSFRQNLNILMYSSHSGSPVGAQGWCHIAWTGQLAAGDVMQLYARYRNGSNAALASYIEGFPYLFVDRIVAG